MIMKLQYRPKLQNQTQEKGPSLFLLASGWVKVGVWELAVDCKIMSLYDQIVGLGSLQVELGWSTTCACYI